MADELVIGKTYEITEGSNAGMQGPLVDLDENSFGETYGSILTQPGKTVRARATGMRELAQPSDDHP